MLHNRPEKELVHKYWIKGNQRFCLNTLDGKCDKLGQNSDEYSYTLKWATIYEFLYPFIIFVLFIFLTHQVIFSVGFSVFSAIFLPIFPLIEGGDLIVVSILLIIGIVIEIWYMIYLFRQIGIYVLIPLIAFFCQLLLVFIPYIGIIVGSFLGLVPWSVIAVGVHYIHYEIGMGIVFNTEERCYIEQDKKDFFLKW